MNVNLTMFHIHFSAPSFQLVIQSHESSNLQKGGQKTIDLLSMSNPDLAQLIFSIEPTRVEEIPSKCPILVSLFSKLKINDS